MEPHRQDSIGLSDLAFATFVYASTSGYDKALRELHDQTGGALDLRDGSHVRSVIAWLRKWKCRNLEIKHEQRTVESISQWYSRKRHQIGRLPNELSSYNNDTVDVLADVFEDISDSKATPAKRIGPTAASKILYLLKPGALPPWDERIRGTLHHNGSGASYARFVADCHAIGSDILNQCRRADVALRDVVAHGREAEVSLAKAIDEYYWTTITLGVPTPTSHDYETWLRLSALPRGG